MSGFKLLAIRPLEDCDEKFKKNLKAGVIYKFYQDYKFKDKDCNEINLENDNLTEAIHQIDPPKDKDETSLYSQNGVNINISAVVGQNGSGKSALTELFLKAMFDLSIQEEWISKELLEKQFAAEKEFIQIQSLILQKKISEIISKGEQELNSDQLIDLYSKFYHYNIKLRDHNSFVGRLDILEESKLFFEIIYVNEQKDTIIIRRKKGEGKIVIDGLAKTDGNYDYKKLFYNVFLNYSIYGLNAKEIGNWIDFLYHKNDGYRTPVVINPQKSEGNIDVNKEEQLGRYRINRTAFATGKLMDLDIDKVKFKLKKSSINYEFLYDFKTDLLVARFPLEEAKYKLDLNKRSPIDFLQTVFDIDLSSAEEVPDFIDFVIKYFLGKLFKSDNSYGLGVFELDSNSGDYFVYGLRADWIDKIQISTSHKYLKLKQVIDSIKNKLPQILKVLSYCKSNDWVDFKTFQENLNFSEEAEKDEDLLTSFTSLFEVDYKFVDNSEYSKFSSGQKQFVNTIETINYHIRNVVSNVDGYRSINVILDEVELYYHPEYQRQLIQKMIASFNTLGLSNEYSINVLFLTHSPFILSDIPAQNILRLEKGLPSTKPFEDTFGANIHNLLANDFFLKESFMGEFAKDKINEVINFLTNKRQLDKLETMIPKLKDEIAKIDNVKSEKSKKLNARLVENEEELTKLQLIKFDDFKLDCLAIINVIGEKAIHGKLLEMFASAFPEFEYEKQYQKELELLKKRFKK